jgi:hypothetical protein
MTVRELIEQLEGLDPEATIVLTNDADELCVGLEPTIVAEDGLVVIG